MRDTDYNNTVEHIEGLDFKVTYNGVETVITLSEDYQGG